VLTAALALVALPGLAGSRAPSPIEPVPAGAFQQLTVPADESRQTASIGSPDAAHASEGSVDGESPIVEPGTLRDPGPAARAAGTQPGTRPSIIRKAPRYTLTGFATFYDHGTTAMRLPRGTVVVICGDGGCIERVVSDYGPQKKSRVVDLYRPDFFNICGCQWFAGTTTVTVYVY
jgi:3D (Asp-Asp-Asp) domain-containing protein